MPCYLYGNDSLTLCIKTIVMIISSNNVPANTELTFDICIIGAGPAGITLARELKHLPIRICLLESGSFEFNEATQALCEGENTGSTFTPMHEMRRRQFGGLSSTWNIEISEHLTGVRYMPLDAIDFEKREGVPYSGWPFAKAHLDPYYQRAHEVCKLGLYTYNVQDWEKEDNSFNRLDLNEERVQTSMFQFGPKNVFAGEYRKDLEQSDSVTLLLQSNVVELETNDTATTVTKAQVANLEGNRFAVSAKAFVLATGGIENARLLLLSNKIEPNGLGNKHDLVGRFFMDHPLVRCGILVPKDPDIFNHTSLYDLHTEKETPVMGKLTLAEALLRNQQLLNSSALLFPRKKEYKPSGKESLKAISSSIRKGRIPHGVLGHLKTVAQDLDVLTVFWFKHRLRHKKPFPHLSKGGWFSSSDKEKKYSVFEVIQQTEQAPHPDNRVTLSSKRDALGCPKASLNWHWRQTDTESLQQWQGILAEEFTRAGLGKLHIEQEDGRPHMLAPSTHHNMGTTRMHDDPTQGVVDKNCRVHHMSNLFVAGSSVFPTGGYANPTLTIVALAVRLGEFLEANMEALMML